MKHPIATASVLTLGLLVISCGGGGQTSPQLIDGEVTPPVVTPPVVTPPTPPANRCATVRMVSEGSDLVPGPLSRGRMGDFVIENTEMRAIIQQPGRNWFSIAQFGGNIVDAVLRNDDGSLAALDHYEESVLGTNIESAPNYQTVEIVNEGGVNADGSCNPAILRFTGPDDLLDFINASSAIVDMGFMFPADADDVDLPLTFQTDYTLNAEDTYVTMDTTAINDTAAAVDMYMVEYMNGAGEVELFQHGYGFGEVLLTSPCDSCRYALYAGHDGGAGVSYGIIHDFPTSTSLSVSGVTIQVYGSDAVGIALGASAPPFTVPANGTLLFKRWFAVGDGTVASILDVKNEVLGTATGTIEGSVVDANGPVANAEIAVITTNNDFATLGADLVTAAANLPIPLPNLNVGLPRGPAIIVANHFRTTADGTFSGTLPPGDYELRVNVPNRLAPTPATAMVTVSADQTTTVPEFTAPMPGRLQVFVRDENNEPVAATVQLIGVETSPDAGEPLNSESIAAGVLTTMSGVFGDPFADPTANGIVLTEFAVSDPLKSGAAVVGAMDTQEIEPGNYQLSVSHGLRYSEFVQDVTITAGNLTTVNARIAKVVPTPGHLFGDFHVHAFDSPDSEVTGRERVATYLAEDIDFFTPSDHGMRVDFAPVVADMNVGNLIATAPSAEMTTFDYGHLNAWPVAIETNPASDLENSQSGASRTSQGAVDWGGATAPGLDFPSAGNYGLTPGQIYAEADLDPVTAGRQVVQQINHIEGHFGPMGLSIDTGVSPPQSAAGVAVRKRLDPGVTNLYDDNYDALEVWIGTDGRISQFTHLFTENMGDWFNLINQGLRKTGASSSDTHQRRVTGMNTRNVISVPASLMTNGEPDPTKISADPHTVGDAFRAGQSTLSGAAFVTAKLENAAGDIAGLEVTDSFGILAQPLPLAAIDEATTLRLNIKSPTWAEYDQIAVFVNGRTQRQTDGLQNTTPARYNICAPTVELNLAAGDFVRNTVTVATLDNVEHQRFESSVDVPITSPDTDYWVMVLVRGRDGVSRPMYPVVPSDFSNENDDGSFTTRTPGDIGIPALTISNPIFVDADNNGAWNPPGVQLADGSLAGQLTGSNCTVFDAPAE